MQAAGAHIGEGRPSCSLDPSDGHLARDVDGKRYHNGPMGIKRRHLIWDIDNKPTPQATTGSEQLQAMILYATRDLTRPLDPGDEIQPGPVDRARRSLIWDIDNDPKPQDDGKSKQLQATISYTSQDQFFRSLNHGDAIQETLERLREFFLAVGPLA